MKRSLVKIAVPRLAVIFAVLVLSGCLYIRNVDIKRPELVGKGKTVFVYGLEDRAKIRATIRQGLSRMGFAVVEEKNNAELMVDYNCSCHWDAIHYTCDWLILHASEAKSDQLVFKAEFRASETFSAEYQIERMFKRVEEELAEAAKRK